MLTRKLLVPIHGARDQSPIPGAGTLATASLIGTFF